MNETTQAPTVAGAKPVPTSAMDDIAGMTPFAARDLTTEHFSRGHMLGGAGAVAEAESAAAWTNQE